MGTDFIEERRQELETFLRVIASHQTLRFDPQLKEFLTFEDAFEKYKSNPTAYEKAIGYMEYIPRVKNLSMNSVKSAIQNQIVNVKTQIYQVGEPEELKAQNHDHSKYVDLELKQAQIMHNLQLF
mmetsp:Transcript_40835/g.39424  ORF Transcript_40835/g.39424 Transcript_40835/m.39424 type:complete len:125 (-) Transcript_40835:771-1145(-)